ncbi:unnamed protein product [Kuraishia capsulata CBS 1993]|uniref:Thioredoxin domain-containing protein n=1 Tax=Kuraishia capsulata CBS 1993 TaxID=1382522 RepID=W6MQX7_9ASCO|nr:uncharacterized protein KUCA_T00005121001 [Kuraishia capsulata CBS 1993]CDK29134.1 unnamed protein product [Kuraishia capsulata CBS 1993]
MSVVEIESEEQFSKLTSEVARTRLIALYFHTPWASPCIQMNTVFATLAGANPEILFLSVNADDHSEISELFDVSSVPYFILIRDGTILKELSGADPKEFVNALAEFSTVSTETPEKQESKAAVTSVIPEEESEEELRDRLTKLTSATSIMLFMKGTPSAPQCGFSRQLVAILREHQVRFGFFDILKDDSVRSGLKKFSDWPTFPQLYINGEFQGGLDIIKENLEDDPNFFQNALGEQ